jgi:hypothetical protein
VTLILNIFEKANNVVRQVKFASDKDFCSRIKKAWEVFDKYYTKTDTTPLYAAALILHPTHRTAYIKANWPAKWIKPALKKVTELWESYRDANLISPTISMSYDSTRDKQPEKEKDEFDEIAESLKKYARPASQDEFQDYCNGEPYDIGKQTALQWWSLDLQKKRWPRLARMALDILSIPAMSDEPERVFSGARRTVSWDRTQMTATTLEWVECLKHWKRSGVLDELLNK